MGLGEHAMSVGISSLTSCSRLGLPAPACSCTQGRGAAPGGGLGWLADQRRPAACGYWGHHRGTHPRRPFLVRSARRCVVRQGKLLVDRARLTAAGKAAVRIVVLIGGLPAVVLVLSMEAQPHAFPKQRFDTVGRIAPVNSRSAVLGGCPETRKSRAITAYSGTEERSREPCHLARSTPQRGDQ